jgi:sulfatase-modifying factor enzyme 1
MKPAKVIGPIIWACLLSCVTRGGQAADADVPAPQSLPIAAKTATSHSPEAGSTACPSDMVEVEGDYCPNEEQTCLYNTDISGKRLSTPPDLTWACGEFKPSRCLSDTVHMHFCIDKYEWPNKEGQKPQDWMTWYDAKKAVESVGKRLCTHKEWSLAAEGPDMHPLPYGDGYHRDSSFCNFDNHNPGIDVFKSKRSDDEASNRLRDILVPAGSKDCASDFGVHDMAGNIDEWVVNEASNILECPPEVIKEKKCGNLAYRSGLMGGHIWHVRNASRPMTVAHNASFGWYETGTRACKDLK